MGAEITVLPNRCAWWAPTPRAEGLLFPDRSVGGAGDCGLPWQDEQVGPYFATMLDRFTGTDKVHFTLVNGNHTEPLIPSIFARWLEFLSFYVRKEIPHTAPIDTT